MSEDQLQRPSFAPRNWVGWTMVGLMWLLGRLPMAVGRGLARLLAPLFYHLLGTRRRIAERNIRACYPEATAAERQAILKGSFHSLSRMLIETAWCWSRPRRHFDGMGDVSGTENILAGPGEKGCLVITAHVTCLEIGASFFGELVPFKAVYRPLRSEVLEWYQNRGRVPYCEGLIPRREMRAAVRFLRKGGVLWYAPDQDFGPDQSLFAPFFGIQTATLMATHRLPKMTGCHVVFMFPRYRPETRRYEVEISKPLEDFPTEDAQADLERVNALLEEQVRKAPEQYWWIHRRFKTRPPGEPSFYGVHSRARVDS